MKCISPLSIPRVFTITWHSALCCSADNNFRVQRDFSQVKSEQKVCWSHHIEFGRQRKKCLLKRWNCKSSITNARNWLFYILDCSLIQSISEQWTKTGRKSITSTRRLVSLNRRCRTTCPAMCRLSKSETTISHRHQKAKESQAKKRRTAQLREKWLKVS